MRIRQLNIPYLPPQVCSSDIQTNGKLFSDQEIAEIKNARMPGGRYRLIAVTCRQKKLRYAVIDQGGKLFAVYSGQHELGSGAFGKVKLAQDLATGEWLALKIQPVKGEKGQSVIHQIEDEVAMLAIMKKVVLTHGDSKPVTLERWSPKHSRKQHYMLMQYVRGTELFSIPEDSDRNIKPAHWIKLIVNMLEEIERVHHKKILHRDIKLENFQIHLGEDETSLLDFGFARKVNYSHGLLDDELLGTPWYVAPELLSNKRGSWQYNEKTEVYALGVTLAFLFGFSSQSDAEESKLNFKRTIQFITPTQLRDNEHTHNFGNTTRDAIFAYIKRMTDNDPPTRPTIAESIDYFKNVLRKSNDRTLAVGLLDVRAFNRMIDESGDDANNPVYIDIISRLKKYDYVWFVDKNLKFTPGNYVQMRQLLELAGVSVSDRLYTGVDAANLVRPLMQKQAKESNDYIYTFESVTAPATLTTSAPGFFNRYLSKMRSIKADQPSTWPKNKNPKA